MRRVVYYTDRGARTPHLEDALIVGIDRMALIPVSYKPALPPKRAEALENLKKGLTFC